MGQRLNAFVVRWVQKCSSLQFETCDRIVRHTLPWWCCNGSCTGPLTMNAHPSTFVAPVNHQPTKNIVVLSQTILVTWLLSMERSMGSSTWYVRVFRFFYVCAYLKCDLVCLLSFSSLIPPLLHKLYTYVFLDSFHSPKCFKSFE